jgi:hypothetical protein
MKLAGHVAHMGKERRAVLIAISEGKKPLRRPRSRWEDNTKINLKRNRIRGCGQ